MEDKVTLNVEITVDKKFYDSVMNQFSKVDLKFDSLVDFVINTYDYYHILPIVSKLKSEKENEILQKQIEKAPAYDIIVRGANKKELVIKNVKTVRELYTKNMQLLHSMTYENEGITFPLEFVGKEQLINDWGEEE